MALGIVVVQVTPSQEGLLLGALATPSTMAEVLEAPTVWVALAADQAGVAQPVRKVRAVLLQIPMRRFLPQEELGAAAMATEVIRPLLLVSMAQQEELATPGQPAAPAAL